MKPLLTAQGTCNMIESSQSVVDVDVGFQLPYIFALLHVNVILLLYHHH